MPNPCPHPRWITALPSGNPVCVRCEQELEPRAEQQPKVQLELALRVTPIIHVFGLDLSVRPS